MSCFNNAVIAKRLRLAAAVADESKKVGDGNLGHSCDVVRCSLDIREAREEVHMSDALIAPIFGLTLGGLFVAAHVISVLAF